MIVSCCFKRLYFFPRWIQFEKKLSALSDIQGADMAPVGEELDLME
jgi:hypothetical protein